MAQPQQQSYSMAQQATLSPPNMPPSPGSQPQFAQPNKRVKLSPPGEVPGSTPYVQSPYTASPGASAPHSASASPHFPTAQLPQQVYNTPYSNGGQTTPTLSLPQAHQPNLFNTPQQSPLAFPGQNPINNHINYNTNHMMQTPQSTGTMGPPSKPFEKPKEDGIDVMDVLGGTGIDLREEEQYTFQMYNNSFNSQISGSQSGTISSGHSFTQFPPGDDSSFYGAGPANAKAEEPKTDSQDEFHRKVAEKAWQDAAHNLAVSRQRELNNPFLIVGNLHKKMDKIARENGLNLNTEANKSMGTMKLPDAFPSPLVEVRSEVGPEGTFTTTQGRFIPFDSLLVDQLALISISTKHRLRGLVGDAAALSRGRQTGSHGLIPAEWTDAAAPSVESASSIVNGGLRSGWESAVSPHTNPLKRSHSTANGIPTPVSEGAKSQTAPLKLQNEVVSALRQSAKTERDYEEARLKKRNARASGETPSRQSSIMPSTPGSVAPESVEKAPTKKELKKKAEAKTSEAANHAAANVTTNKFLGGGGNIFGKKGKKTYSWMTGSGGGSGSGTNTPSRLMTQGLSGMAAPIVQEKLTSDGARRLGTWREDKEKGRGVQIRDWVTVLEGDGREKRALQAAYATLDNSDPK